jgi:hypothetical protein
VARAIEIAAAGALINALQLPGAVRLMMPAGIITQEATMQTLQTFSHFQRPRNLIGSVNTPFSTPDKTAKSAPASAVVFKALTFPLARP